MWRPRLYLRFKQNVAWTRIHVPKIVSITIPLLNGKLPHKMWQHMPTSFMYELCFDQIRSEAHHYSTSLLIYYLVIIPFHRYLIWVLPVRKHFFLSAALIHIHMLQHIYNSPCLDYAGSFRFQREERNMNSDAHQFLPNVKVFLMHNISFLTSHLL